MKTILIPVTHEVSAEKLKIALKAVLNNEKARIILMHIIGRPIALDYMTGTYLATHYVLNEDMYQEEVFYKEMAKTLSADGYEVEVSVPVGFFDEVFTNLSNSIKPDLVIMFTHGNDEVIDELFGSHTSDVIQKINSPIMVIPFKYSTLTLKKALVALELDDDEFPALSQYFQFIEKHDIQTYYIKINSQLQFDIIDDEQVLNHLNKEYPGRIHNIIHRRSDNVAEGLIKYANDSSSDFIVLFTTKRNLIERLFHKSVTKDMALHSDRPLLIFHY